MTDDGRPVLRARAAEGRRNRQALLAAAAAAFAADGQSVSLETIARQAGVGIGTLYRHFPGRQALVAAVYADQVARLEQRARTLLDRHPSAAALRAWLPAFVTWAVTKHGMTDTLAALMASGELTHGELRAQLVEIVQLFLDAGSRDGALRSDVRAQDVAAMFAGVLAVSGGRRAQARRMLDLVADGLVPRGC